VEQVAGVGDRDGLDGLILSEFPENGAFARSTVAYDDRLLLSQYPVQSVPLDEACVEKIVALGFFGAEPKVGKPERPTKGKYSEVVCCRVLACASAAGCDTRGRGA
jgi:hypothetical protein